MVSSRTNVILRSTALFTAIGAAQIHLHELGHAVTAIALGFRPVFLFPTRVDSPAYATNLPHTAITAAAGPLTSLVTALIAFLVYRALRPRLGAEARLALVWCIYFGVLISVGYLFLTPFAGDTHTIARIVGLPPLVQWAALGAGIYAMTRVGAPLLDALGPLAPSPDRVATPEARVRYTVDVAVIPWLVWATTGLLVTWSAPSASWAELVPFITFGVPLVANLPDARKRDDLKSVGLAWGEGPLPWIGFAIFAAFIALDALVLRTGVPLVR